MPTDGLSTANDTATETIRIGRSVLEIESGALSRLAAGLDQNFADAVELILKIDGRVICSGMGKSGHVARKIAATLASTGTPAFFVHPGEQIFPDPRAEILHHCDDVLAVGSRQLQGR